MLRDLYVTVVFLSLLLSADAFALSSVMAAANKFFGIDWISWESICVSARISGAMTFICCALGYIEVSRIRSEIQSAEGEKE